MRRCNYCGNGICTARTKIITDTKVIFADKKEETNDVELNLQLTT